MPESKCILVVDDEEDLRIILGSLLESMGYEIQTANDGVEALKMIESQQGMPFYAIVSDWMMPNGNGMELLNQLRSGPSRATPFVLMTGAYSAEQLRNVQNLGPDSTLIKPFSKTVLKEKIEEAVRIRQSSTG